MGAGREHERRQGLGCLAVLFAGAVPDAESLTGEVHIRGILLTVVHVRLFSVEIAQLVGGVLAEEGLVATYHLLILLEASNQAPTQTDDVLHAVGGPEGIEKDGIALLTYAVHAASALDQSDDGPGQVIVDHDVPVL